MDASRPRAGDGAPSPETPLSAEDDLTAVDGGWILAADQWGKSHSGPGRLTHEQYERVFWTGSAD